MDGGCSVSVSRSSHAETEDRYFCPVCGEWVNGPETRCHGVRPEREVEEPTPEDIAYEKAQAIWGEMGMGGL